MATPQSWTHLPAMEAPEVSQANTIVLSSVLAAATAITAAVVYINFSNYRRWIKDRDDNLATKKISETTKQKKSGFEAVASSWAGQAMEVAVKKVMQTIEDCRYDDFLAKDVVTSLFGRSSYKALSTGHGRLQAMSFRVLHKLWLPHNCIPDLCTVLLIIWSPLCCSSVKSEAIPCHLGSYIENSPFPLNLTNQASFCIPNLTPPGVLKLHSFPLTVLSFNMSIYQQVNNLPNHNGSVFFLALHPTVYDVPVYPYPPFTGYTRYYPDLYYCMMSRTYSRAVSEVSVEIRRPVDGTILIWVQIDMDAPYNSSSTVENSFILIVSFDHLKGGRMSVNISGDGMRNDVYTETMIGVGMYSQMSTSLCHFSSMGQLLNVDNWNVERRYSNPTPWSSGGSYSSESQGSSMAAILSSVFGSVAAVAITATVIHLYFNSKYRRWKNEQEKLTKIMQGLPGVPTKVEFTDIKKATKNFHETMKLGKGGFGAVFRCMLPASASRTGQAMEVAVKKFMQEVEERRYDDFLAEVSIINRLRHKNIVPLVGWSYNKGVPLLVYEYMINGSLDQHLFRQGGHNRDDHIRGTVWQWDTRYNIVRDIATGLHYVHHEHEPMVLHRDIKASNIMLDSNFRARLGDFGIACTVAANKSYVTGIAGTFGYIAPDYAMSHKATRQTDIYAFGVLILEIITGKKNMDVLPENDHITEWVWRHHREGKLLEAADSFLTSGDKKQDNVIFIDEVKRLLLLGLACTNPNPFNRPRMVDVVQMINKLAPPPEVPFKRPTFVWPPEDWRTRNSMYSTAMSEWERSPATSTLELF